MNHYIQVLKKYAEFSGRASRAEFWYFFLISSLIALGLAYLPLILRLNFDGMVLVSYYQIAVNMPFISVGVRRMHDVGKSGWHLLIPIYNYVLLAKKGTKGDNKFGRDPLN